MAAYIRDVPIKKMDNTDVKNNNLADDSHRC